MPKIIENLEEEIAKTALRLFRNDSYQNVSMRKIASELDIAVGTLYNYYPNKWELYIEVFEESWKETYLILKENCKNTDGDYLRNYLEVIYSEMRKKKSIVKELFRYIINNFEIGEEEKKEKFKRIRFPEVLINQIYELFVAVLEKEFKIKLRKDNQDLYRLFTMIQTDIPVLQQNFEKEAENIKFLSEIVSSYISDRFSK